MAEPLTGVLGADFSAFVAECTKANTALAALVASSGRVEEALGKLATKTDENEVSFTKLVSSYVSGDAIIGILKSSFEALTGVVTASVASAVESENAQSRLAAALQSQGLAMPSVIDAYSRYATNLQQTSIYSDDAAKSAETLLTMVGHVMPRDMEAALTATANLASGLKIDLPEAAAMVSKALEGNEGALKKAGIQFDTTKGQVISFDDIIKRVNDNFGGQAAAAVDTYAGRIAQLENAWSSALGAIGRVITDNQTVATAISLVTRSLTANTGELNANKTANDLVSLAVIGLAKAFDLTLAAAQLVISGYDALVTAGNGLASSIFAFTASSIEALRQLRIAYSYVNPSDYIFAENFQREIDLMAGAADYLRGRVETLGAETASSNERTQRWNESIGSLRAGLGDYIAKLEATRGQVGQHTAATEENTAAAGRNTTSRLGQTAADAAHAKQLKENADWMKTQQDVEVKYYADMEKLNAAYTAVVGKASHDTTQAQINDAWAVADAAVAAATKSGLFTSEMYEKIYAIAAQTVDNIIQKTLELDQFTHAHYQKMADDARIAYAFALAHEEEYTPKAIQLMHDRYEASLITLANWQDAADAALTKTKGTAELTGDAIEAVSHRIQGLSGGGGSGGGGGAGGGSINSAAQSFFAPYLQPTGTTGLPGLPANWYEMMSGQSTFATPGIFAGQNLSPIQWHVNVAQGAVTMNYPIMNDPAALQQLGDTVGRAILSNVTRTGTPV